MKTISYYLFILYLISVSPLTIATSTTHLPDSLSYNNKPIDSLCFASPDKIINLTQCGLKHEKYRIQSINPQFTTNGFIGSHWENTDKSFTFSGFSYYKFFYIKPNQYWIYSIYNGGGSGNFSNLFLVKRKNKNILNTYSIASGDRCNKGIQDVKINNGRLTFSINLTPYDIMTYSDNKKKITYDDLSSCAICCAATAIYSVNNHKETKLNYINISSFRNDIDTLTQGRYQQCFNQLLKSYLNKQKILFKQNEIAYLIKQFEHKCVK